MRELPTDDFTEALDMYLRYKKICPKHEQTKRSRVRKFVEWAGGSISLSELTADKINEYIAYLESQNLTPATVKGYRAIIVTVLRFIRWKPEEWPYIRTIKERRIKVEGWTKKEIELLLRAAYQMGDSPYPNGIRKSDFWITAILAGFSTGLRFSDLASVQVKDIHRDGSCRVIQSKTGHVVSVRFSKESLHYIRRHGQPVVLPMPHTHQWFCRWFRRLVQQAGIRHGTFKFLRRSAGSYAEAKRAGAGRLLLGHTNSITFEKNYRVDEIVAPDPIEPPSLRLNENPMMEAVKSFGKKLIHWRGTAG